MALIEFQGVQRRSFGVEQWNRECIVSRSARGGVSGLGWMLGNSISSAAVNSQADIAFMQNNECAHLQENFVKNSQHTCALTISDHFSSLSALLLQKIVEAHAYWGGDGLRGDYCCNMISTFEA